MVLQNNPAPFGASVGRFGKITLHPSLDKSGLYTVRDPGCDPCRYHPIPLHIIFQVNKNRTKDKDPWRYKNELEEWSKNLGYRNQKILDQRKWTKSILGPAWGDLHEPAPYESACKNVGFGRAPRSRPSKERNPAPGTYYKAVPFKAPYGPHSVLPSFEQGEACRFKDTSPKWSLAPNRYKIIDKESIEQKSNKIVSLRGPYDLFTGKRDASTVISHYSDAGRCSAATWPIALPGSFDKYKKSHFGEMNRTTREKPYRGRNALVDLTKCLRNPDEPGPAHLNIDKPKVFKQNKYGFNSSYDRPPGYQPQVVWPAVGRYRHHPVDCGILGQGHKHSFISKVQRSGGAPIVQPMNSF